MKYCVYVITIIAFQKCEFIATITQQDLHIKCILK